MVSRIIAGSLASRRFATPNGTTTRPTTDRVRESVFAQLASTLGQSAADPSQQLTGLRFLDLYAGSGGVGLEAYSRGAEVTWVDKATSRLISSNLKALSVQGKVVGSDIMKYLTKPAEPFDIIWMDPPYEVRNSHIEKILGILSEKQWINSGGLVLIERPGHSSAVEFPESFLNVRSRRLGDTVVYFTEKGNM